MIERDRFIEWAAKEHLIAGEDIEFDEARNCFKEYRVHLAWKAWQASASIKRRRKTEKKYVQEVCDITAEMLPEIFDYHAESGSLIWRPRVIGPLCRSARGVKQFNARFTGKVAGVKSRFGYIVVGLGGKQYFAHRIVFALRHGRWPTLDVDHIDGNRSNNRVENLRELSRTHNSQNRRVAHAGNATGLLGVTYNKKAKRYESQINILGKRHFLGYFDSPVDAHQAYLDRKRRDHAGCTI